MGGGVARLVPRSGVQRKVSHAHECMARHPTMVTERWGQRAKEAVGSQGHGGPWPTTCFFAAFGRELAHHAPDHHLDVRSEGG